MPPAGLVGCGPSLAVRNWELSVSAAELTDLSVVNAIPAHIWRAAPDGAILFVNQQWMDYTGLTQEQSQGWGWASTDVIHADDLPGLLETWQRVLRRGQPDEAEVRVRRFDGVYRWYLIRTVPVRSDSGDIIGWFGTNTDIEDRKQAEQRIRASESEYRRIIDAIPQLIAALSPDGQVL
jgi:PAS domain S-box-containing protein